MKKYIIILVFIAISCKGKTEKTNQTDKPTSEIIKTSEYQLIKTQNQNGLLILFPCYPCDAENTLNELKIAETGIDNGFSVLAMNFNQKLYLKTNEKQDLADRLTKIVQEHNLPNKNIYVGGFSSGGNVSLLMSDYLINNDYQIRPKGVFVVDSPIDLLGLYQTAEKNLKLKFSESSIQESRFIKELFDKEFGKPVDGITNYELNSPFTFETQNIDNLKGLEKLKIRLYTEPDLKWWNEHTKNDYEDLNAFFIQKLSEQLKTEFGNKNIELIKTENRGYRANGERHPHSWAIVDEKELINWMLE